jgi:hypothetical protein
MSGSLCVFLEHTGSCMLSKGILNFRKTTVSRNDSCAVFMGIDETCAVVGHIMQNTEKALDKLIGTLHTLATLVRDTHWGVARGSEPPWDRASNPSFPEI